MTGALSGIRVVEFTSFTAGPLCGELLCQLGADVLKVEPVEGEAVRHLGYPVDGSSYLFHINNGGKHSVTLNIKNAKGRDIVLRLLRDAEVLLENVAPGSLQRLGLGYEAAAAVNPRLIYCSLSGYGYTGPFAGRRSYDVVVQGLTGIIGLTGHGNREVKVGPSITDLVAAAAATAAITMAVYHQQRTGEGQHIDMSLYDTGAWLSQEAWPAVLADGRQPPLVGNAHRTLGPQNLYEARDGQVAIAVESDAQWRRLCTLIRRPELARALECGGAQDRARNAAADMAIVAWVQHQLAAQVVQACQSADIPAVLYRELPAVVDDPELRRRGAVVDVQHPGGGTIRLPGSPFLMSETPGRVDRAAERLGASNMVILHGMLGYSVEEIEQLARDGVILWTAPDGRAATSTPEPAEVPAK